MVTSDADATHCNKQEVDVEGRDHTYGNNEDLSGMCWTGTGDVTCCLLLPDMGIFRKTPAARAALTLTSSFIWNLHWFYHIVLIY